MSGSIDRRTLLAGTLAACAGRESAAGRPLFDGSTLAGWHKNPQRIGHGTGGRWFVEDGAICGEQDPPGSGNGGVLLTDETFGDFELTLELKPDWAIDSGLFLRSDDAGRCIQMMVDYHEKGNVGHLYGEGTGGWSARAFSISGGPDTLTAAPDAGYGATPALYTCTPDAFLKAWRCGDWNRARVRCVGALPHITTWINDVKIVEFDAAKFAHPRFDPKLIAARGSIAVQVHGGAGGWKNGARCRWRGIRIQAL